MSGRIVVLISGIGSNMDALIDACKRGEVPGEVVAVAADRECVGIKRAESLGIPTVLLEPDRFGSREEWSAALRDRIASFDPDLVVSAGFMRILPPVFVEAFLGRLINIHPSLLPEFPGAHGVRDALAAGVEETGSTVHFVDFEVDRGPTILRASVPVKAGDTEASLHERIKSVEHRILPEACKLVLSGAVTID